MFCAGVPDPNQVQGGCHGDSGAHWSARTKHLGSFS